MKELLLPVFILFTFSGYGQSWVTIGSSGLSDGQVNTPDIAIDSSGTPYIVYSDYSNSQKITVMKYNGSSWEPVGSPGFSDSIAGNTSIAIDNSGTPYVVYEDYSQDLQATVKKYDGSSWVTVGSPGFTSNQAVGYNRWIAIDNSGTPYVAYSDFGVGGYATVMKYNGSNWVTVGSPGFSANYTQYVSIALDTGGTPYVVYLDWGYNYKATVMKYNGSSWITMGSPGFSAAEADYTTIAIDSSGTPYIGYEDYSQGLKATVMKYNDSSWVTIDSAGFSAGEADFTSIAIDNGGTPYVVYEDAANGGKATVMRYNGSNWVIVGNVGFSAGLVGNTAIAIDNSGRPYVSYMEDYIYDFNATAMKLDADLSPITGVDTLCVGDTATLSDIKNGGVWSSSNFAIASIGSTGIISGISTGIATISYTKSGYSVIYMMVVDSIPMVGTIIAPDSICPGNLIQMYNSASGGSWYSLDTSIATITSTGLLTGVEHGLVNLMYIITNPCGIDTGVYPFLIGSCTNGIKNIGPPTISYLTTFPNPNNGSFTLNISSPQNEQAAITITNILGEKVKELTVNTNTDTQVEMDGPPGMYFLTAVVDGGVVSGKVEVW